jgi:HSP20 family protein
MANLTVFDPFEDKLDDLFKGFFLKPISFEGAQPTQMRMKLDVAENDTAYTIRADIPGVKKEDIKISVDGNQVSISAETKREKDVKKDDKIVHSERYYGSVARSFTLAHDVDDKGASAKYNDGVLELTLPKSAAAKTKQISVQ